MRPRLIAKSKQIANELVQTGIGSDEQLVQVVRDRVAQEHEVGSLAFVIMVKIILFIIEHMLLSGGLMPSDDTISNTYDVE